MRSEEKIIIQELCDGNKRVFRAIYEQYYAHMVTFASGYLHEKGLSEDVVQNFFVYLWKNRKSLDIHSSLRSFIFTSIRNRCLNKLRDMKLRDEKNIIYLNTILDMEELIEQDQEFADSIRKAVDELPEQMKVVFEKKYFEGLKSKQIADELSITENTVNTQLKRGKKKLRSILDHIFSIYILF